MDSRFTRAAFAGIASERKTARSSMKLEPMTTAKKSGSLFPILCSISMNAAVAPPTWASAPDPSSACPHAETPDRGLLQRFFLLLDGEQQRPVEAGAETIGEEIVDPPRVGRGRLVALVREA